MVGSAPGFVSVQNQYNILHREPEDAVLPACERAGMAFLPYFPLASGLLSGKYRAGEPVPPESLATDPSGAGFIRRFLNDDLLRRVAALAPIAEEAGLTQAQLAVAWVLQNPNVSAAIIGATRPEQVRENVKASGVRLAPEVLRRIDDVLGDAIRRDPALTTSPESRP